MTSHSPEAVKAAEAIALKYLSEPCREVDDDGKVCAWRVDPDAITDLAAIIEKHCGDAEKPAGWAGGMAVNSVVISVAWAAAAA